MLQLCKTLDESSTRSMTAKNFWPLSGWRSKIGLSFSYCNVCFGSQADLGSVPAIPPSGDFRSWQKRHSAPELCGWPNTSPLSELLGRQHPAFAIAGTVSPLFPKSVSVNFAGEPPLLDNQSSAVIFWLCTRCGQPIDSCQVRPCCAGFTGIAAYKTGSSRKSGEPR